MKVTQLIAGLVAGGALLAQPLPTCAESGNLVVVELFTSQGCSSCPPADALLAKLALRDDVLPLALHVDYWDYIGWADTFARPENTERQKAYARVAGSRSIYTPQMVVDGRDQIVGTRPMEVAEAVMDRSEAAPPVALTVTREGGDVWISAPSMVHATAPLTIQLVRYIPERVVEIERGENAGKVVSYSNIVTSWDVIGDWSPAEPLDMKVPVPDDDAAAVLLQQAGPGPIVAAARLP
ncbi:DUF1223 domain-containing protein [Tropicimonas sp.]|uniref:DUF1223 domain-containing protein n=1 Tax=Tropicimonas sp. TaxID=2067044 RepID=UPI003A883520